MGGRIQQRTIQPIAIDHPGNVCICFFFSVKFTLMVRFLPVPILSLLHTNAMYCSAMKTSSSDASLDSNGRKKAVAKKSTSKAEGQQNSGRGNSLIE